MNNMIEEKFKDFRASITFAQFNDIEFLTAKAEQTEAMDAELSARILVRVKALKKKQANEKGQVEKLTPKQAISDKANALNKIKSSLVARLKTVGTFSCLVIVPSVIFAFYQAFWSTERFESQAQVIVQQPDGMATMDASMMVLSGLGVANTGVSDTELVKAYILSNDMLKYLEANLDLKSHYSQASIDVFSRLSPKASWEDFQEFYQNHIDVYVDIKSNIVFVNGQGFDAQFAHRLTQTIVDRAEWYINSIGHQLAEAQLAFIRAEHNNVLDQLELAQSRLLQFQQKHSLLDPMAEGMAMQQITYGLEGEISAKEAELKGLLSIMSGQAPQVQAIKTQLDALNRQLTIERNKLSTDNEQGLPVSEILAKYTDLKVKMELALQAYTSSQVSLEKSRIEAYRQIKYLVVVQAATEPNDSRYPDVFYNVSLFALISAMLFAVGKIIVTTVRELK